MGDTTPTTICLPVDADRSAFSGSYVAGTINGTKTAFSPTEVRALLGIIGRRLQ